jgi:predicted ester cyclase
MASFYTSAIKVNEVPKEPAAVAAQFTPLFSAFPDWHWEIRTSLSTATISRCTSRSPVPTGGVFQGIEATGRSGDYFGVYFYRLEDDKFAEVWDHTDMDAVMRQIGQDEAHR